MHPPPRTERLLLREFTPDDTDAVLAYHRDPRFRRFLAADEPSEDETRELVRLFVSWQRERPRCRWQWAVTLPGDDRPIGNCGLRMPHALAREAEIGYELDPEHWGRGYATELCRALLRFGFAEAGLHRVSATCLAENAASARVLEKAGMRREGRLRENEWMRERWWDTLLFGVLEDEWKEGA